MPSPARPSGQDASATLSRHGLEPPSFLGRFGIKTNLVVGLCGAGAGIILGYFLSEALASHPRDELKTWMQALSVLLSVTVFLVAYLQWRAGKYETSQDKYYERLKIANEQFAKLPGVDPYPLFVFAELDNLEFAVEKYRVGYMTAEMALRAWRTFQARCADETFRQAARHWVTASGGYQLATRQVVERTIAAMPGSGV